MYEGDIDRDEDFASTVRYLVKNGIGPDYTYTYSILGSVCVPDFHM
jgi:hypothetical protein